MKLLYCERCGDIIAPLPTARQPRKCRCGTHQVWWENPNTGVLCLYDQRAVWRRPGDEHYVDLAKRPPGHEWMNKASAHEAWVLGLNNSFLNYPKGHSKETIRALIESTPSSYIFKTWESMIIRIRPGESNDTDWAEHLPLAYIK